MENKIRPAHYNKELDPFTIAEHYPHLCPKKFTALRYLLRAGQKEGVPEVEDLKKLMECITRRLQEIEPQN